MTQALSKPFFVRLPSRGRVRIAGPDRMAFVQNLASNDMRLLDSQPAVYSCLLTPQGKFMHDFFVTVEADTLSLECEGGARAEDLLRKLKPFRLRSKVELSVETDVPVYAVVFPHPGPLPEGEGGIRASAREGEGNGYADPRHAGLGRRVLLQPTGIEEQPFPVWDAHRISLGVPDGSRDMAVDKDTLLECNMDRLHGVSLNKGCYVGQEITARMHLRGLVKKHLVPIEITGEAPAPFSDISVNGQLVGQMRSHDGKFGLAMIKDDALPILNDASSPVRRLQT